MNPLKEVFESPQTAVWIEAQNAVAFLRPVPDVLVWTPRPTACLAESLRFRQIRLASAQFLFCSFDRRNVNPRPDKLTAAGCIP
jgi:hypothetical protein